MAQKFRDQVNMGIRAAKAGMPGPVNPMNPAFLHMYMPLLDGRFPYNIGPVELAALAMANNFPNVLLGNNHPHNNHSNGSGPAGDSYQQSERANRLSGRSSSSPGTNSNNNNSSSKCSAHSRNSASSSSPVSSSPGHLSQSQATRRSFPSSCHAEEARRKEETAKKAAAVRSDEAPLNLSKPRGSQSRSSPLVQCPASPSPGGQHQQPPSSHHPAQHHQPASPLSGMRSHPMLSPSAAGKFPAWQPSPLFAPGFYSAPPFIPYSRTLPNGAPSDSPHDKPFPFGMFPAGLDGLPGFPAAGQSVASHHNNNGSKKESPGSAGSVGGFSDSSNVDSEKKEDTVVTCQSEYLLRVSCCHSCSSSLTVN